MISELKIICIRRKNKRNQRIKIRNKAQDLDEDKG